MDWLPRRGQWAQSAPRWRPSPRGTHSGVEQGRPDGRGWVRTSDLSRVRRGARDVCCGANSALEGTPRAQDCRTGASQCLWIADDYFGYRAPVPDARWPNGLQPASRQSELGVSSPDGQLWVRSASSAAPARFDQRLPRRIGMAVARVRRAHAVQSRTAQHELAHAESPSGRRARGLVQSVQVVPGRGRTGPPHGRRDQVHRLVETPTFFSVAETAMALYFQAIAEIATPADQHVGGCADACTAGARRSAIASAFGRQRLERRARPVRGSSGRYPAGCRADLDRSDIARVRGCPARRIRPVGCS